MFGIAAGGSWSGFVSDERVDEIDVPMSTRAKVLAVAIVTVALLVAGYAFLRLSSPAIPPTQAKPANHYPFQCWLCHTVSKDATTIGGS
jgi:hypothetical protein